MKILVKIWYFKVFRKSVLYTPEKISIEHRINLVSTHGILNKQTPINCFSNKIFMSRTQIRINFKTIPSTFDGDDTFFSAHVSLLDESISNSKKKKQTEALRRNR